LVSQAVLSEQAKILTRIKAFPTVEEKVAKLVFVNWWNTGAAEIKTAEAKDQLLVVSVRVNRNLMRYGQKEFERRCRARCDSCLQEMGIPDGHPRALILVDCTRNELEFREMVYQQFGA